MRRQVFTKNMFNGIFCFTAKLYFQRSIDNLIRLTLADCLLCEKNCITVLATNITLQICFPLHVEDVISKPVNGKMSQNRGAQKQSLLNHLEGTFILTFDLLKF